MADARYNRQRKVCYVLGEAKCIEARHICRGSASSNDHHDIIVFKPIIDCIEGGDYTFFHLLALHDSGEKRGVERKAILIVV